jgi:hypothetical protein
MSFGHHAVRAASGQVRLTRTGMGLRIARLLALLIVVGGIASATGYALVNRGARRDLDDLDEA